MFRVFGDGFGGFFVIPVMPGDGLIALGMLFVFVLMMLGLATLTGSMLLFPILCILLAISILAAFSRKSAFSVLAPLALPIYAYGVASIGWVLLNVSAHTQWGLVAILAWLLIAMAILYQGGNLCTENGYTGFVFLAVMAVLWVSAFFADPQNPDSGVSLVFYTFRVIHIAVAVMAAVNAVLFISDLVKGKEKPLSTAYDVLVFLLGFVPLITAGIFGGTIHSRAGSVFFILLISAVYAGLGFVVKNLAPAFGSTESATGLLVLPFIATGVMRFAVDADIHYTAPLRSVEEMLNTFRHVPWSGFALQAERLIDHLSAFFSLLLNAILSLVLRIFDTSLPSRIEVPWFAAFLIGLIPFFLAIVGGQALYVKLRKNDLILGDIRFKTSLIIYN